MTLAGKIFTAISFLITITFLVFLTPVVKRQIELQKDVLAIEFGGQDSRNQPHRAHQEIKQNTIALDAERVKLIYDLNRLKNEETAVRTKAENQIDVLRVQLATWTDLESHEKQGVVEWQDNVRDLTSEKQSREREKDRLTEELASFEKARQERDAEVGNLRQALARARKELAEALATMQADYKELNRIAGGVEAEERPVADSR